MAYTIYKDPDFYTYQVGDEVEKTSLYISVPCGCKKYLKKGMRFPNCLYCIDKKEKKMFAQGLELWEKAHQN